MFTTVLQTKLQKPSIRPSRVMRPQLIARLNQGLQDRFLLVAAPAGYGKTTLMVDWLAQLPEDYAYTWLTLDEGDNDPRRFLAYLIAAMEQIQAGFGATVQSLLQLPQPQPDEVIMTALINEMAALSRPFVLVLDDYHFIRALAIHKQLAFLLEHQPANMHLALITREAPLLPVARLRARGQVLEINQDNLRFTPAEVVKFLQGLMGLPLSTDEITTLERRTEGWIAGLQLAALSMQGRDDLSGFIQDFSGSSRFILDFLIEEVFKRQTPEVQDFLLHTSILGRLSGPLCAAVTHQADSQALLETLEKANLFIVSLDQSRTWYRYHHLFAELLRHQLRATHPNLDIQLHRQASHWFETEGLTGEAIQHALAAQDWMRAASLIQTVYTSLLQRGEVLTVIGWFRSLPEDMLRSNPRLSFDYCWPLLLAGQYDEAAPLLEGLEQEAKNIPAFLGEIYAAQAYLARGVGNHARMIERSEQALELLPKSSISSRGIIAMNLGLAYWHTGQMHDAEDVLTEALEIAQATGNLYAALTATIFLGRVAAVRGQLHQAEEYFNRAIQQGGDIPVNALAYIDLATLHYEWNELDASDMFFRKAVALCQQSHNSEFLVGCWLLGLRLRIAQGNTSGAEEALMNAWGLVHAGKISAPMAKRVEVAQAYLLRCKGESIGERGQELADEADCHPFYRFLGVTKARMLPDAYARDYLERLSQIAQSNGWGYGLVAIHALQASFAETQADAQEYLYNALQQAEGGMFIRSFVEVGEKLIPHLREAARRGVSPAYVCRILAVMTEKNGMEVTGLASMVEPLSERELEVLRLVTTGMSNRQIADKLTISTGTAKSHIHHLCGKLGVRNRTEAAMRARELGLV